MKLSLPAQGHAFFDPMNYVQAMLNPDGKPVVFVPGADMAIQGLGFSPKLQVSVEKLMSSEPLPSKIHILAEIAQNFPPGQPLPTNATQWWVPLPDVCEYYESHFSGTLCNLDFGFGAAVPGSFNVLDGFIHRNSNGSCSLDLSNISSGLDKPTAAHLFQEIVNVFQDVTIPILVIANLAVGQTSAKLSPLVKLGAKRLHFYDMGLTATSCCKFMDRIDNSDGFDTVHVPGHGGVPGLQPPAIQDPVLNLFSPKPPCAADTLESLSIGKGRLGLDGVARWCRALLKCKSLTEVHMAYLEQSEAEPSDGEYYFGDLDLDEEAQKEEEAKRYKQRLAYMLPALAKCLAFSPRLLQNLSCLKISVIGSSFNGEVPDLFVKEIIPYVKSRLTVFELSEIDVECVDALVSLYKALSECTLLRTLVVSVHALDPQYTAMVANGAHDGGHPLATAVVGTLGALDQLRVFNISGLFLGDVLMSNVIAAMQPCTNILYIGGTGYGMQTANGLMARPPQSFEVISIADARGLDNGGSSDGSSSGSSSAGGSDNGGSDNGGSADGSSSAGGSDGSDDVDNGIDFELSRLPAAGRALVAAFGEIVLYDPDSPSEEIFEGAAPSVVQSNRMTQAIHPVPAPTEGNNNQQVAVPIQVVLPVAVEDDDATVDDNVPDVEPVLPWRDITINVDAVIRNERGRNEILVVDGNATTATGRQCIHCKRISDDESRIPRIPGIQACHVHSNRFAQPFLMALAALNNVDED